MAQSKSIEKISFEQALAELEEIVRKIDTGQKNLADAVESFERGVLLKKHCESMLKAAKLKIEKSLTQMAKLARLRLNFSVSGKVSEDQMIHYYFSCCSGNKCG